MNPNLRLMTALGMTLLLGTAAYSQMEGGGPAPAAPGMDTSGGGEAPPSFELPSAAGA